MVAAWAPKRPQPVDVETEAEWFRGAMHRICDASMPRVGSRHSGRRQSPWWSPEIARLRAVSIRASRRCTRHRRRRRLRRDEPVAFAEEEARLHREYRAAKDALRLAIRRAKEQNMERLLEALEADPWGSPYKLVRGKLRPWAPSMTERLQPQQLRDIVSALFPQEREGFVDPAMDAPPEYDGEAPAEVPHITGSELRVAVRKMCAKDTAPGPDGVHGRVWALALGALGDRLLRLYNSCLESGRFPSSWRTGRLVLLRKEGRPADTAAGYRPIVLLDEVGKLLERILAAHIIQHLVGVGPDLSAEQYGFREGRSTVDAILRVRALSEKAVSRGGVALAVSLDIANAFNTLPWSVIGAALERHGVPPYLRRLVGSYLEDRSVTCTGHGGIVHRFPVVRGVPQGSVLGPLLWNIGYDWV
ncbi:reverse transcriptase family protein, partial [Pseudomonas aeruginosa]